ncbi:hypothetical protein QFZ33_001988 [Arthrobacter globiformis]|nr:hypothetical protein [Arthrobacter globiformis]
MAGWRSDLHGVPRTRSGLGFPAGEFFGVVARFAQSGAVGQAGGSAVVPGDDVVVVADWGVAVGRAAGVVPGLDEATQRCREETPSRVHGYQINGPGGGIEAPDPGLQLLHIGGGVARSRICTAGRTRPCSPCPCSMRSRVPRRRGRCRSRVSGRVRCRRRDSACRVSTAYTATPWWTGSSAVRYVMQSGAGPPRCGVARALGHGTRVPPDDRRPDRGDNSPGPGTGEGPGVCREFLINRAPAGRTQAGGLFGYVHGALFIQLPVSRAARAWGICTRAFAVPRSRRPRFGDSRRASAICSAAPRSRSFPRSLPRFSAVSGAWSA